MSARLPLIVLFAGSLLSAGDFDRARQLYSRTQYREVIQLLTEQAPSGTGAELALIGKSWFMLAEYKKAGEAFEKAIAAAPGNSEYHNWLGKAYGRRAETSNPFSAPIFANKARQSFEKAVALNGRNAEAVNDLFSYYIEAPGFLGGGIDKAADLAKTRIEPIDPVEYHYAMAQIAEKRKEYKSAEFHFREAFQMAPKSVGRAIDLAKFLANQGRLQESEIVFGQAEKIAPNSPRLLFERASSYIKAKQNLTTAKDLLERYLNSSLTPDDPPRSEAQRLLKQVSSSGA